MSDDVEIVIQEGSPDPGKSFFRGFFQRGAEGEGTRYVAEGGSAALVALRLLDWVTGDPRLVTPDNLKAFVSGVLKIERNAKRLAGKGSASVTITLKREAQDGHE